MVPTIASSGGSFKGAAAYYLHDKDANSAERVEWTHTENMLVDDPEMAWRLMAWTAGHQAEIKAQAGIRSGGRKLTKPVYAFSVSWHPEQRPDKEHMLATAKEAVAALGLAEHQALYVSHNDEEQPHVHILINRVHPDTGLAASMSHDRRKLQAWALAYQAQHGENYCPARSENSRRRALLKSTEKAARKELETPETNPAIATAWRLSDNGRGLVAALKAEGYTLARGNRRLVVVDRFGKTINPVRHLPGVKTVDFEARLADFDQATLPKVGAVQKAIKVAERQRYHAARERDEWAAEYLNKHQDAHLEERSALYDRYHRQLTERRDELAKHYRTAERQAAVDALRQRVERAGVLRRMTGAAAKDRAELETLERQLADVRQRTAEQLDGIQARWDQATGDMAERHMREDVRAREHVAERQAAPPAAEQAHERGGRGSRDRDDDGGRERYRTPRPPWPFHI